MRALLVLASLSFAATAAAQPAHCSRALGAHAWPYTGPPIGAADPTPVTMLEARRAVDAFRREWRSVPHTSAVLQSVTECMQASYEHFVVRRVAVDEARRTFARGAASPLSGSASALPQSGWVWEVYWGGGSRRHPPSGPVSAYFTPDLATLVVAVQWPEG